MFTVYETDEKPLCDPQLPLKAMKIPEAKTAVDKRRTCQHGKNPQ